MDCTAIILAGGKSTRIGSEKGMVKFKGTPMISHVIKTVEKLNIPIIIISSNSIYEQFKYTIYADLIPNKGPLGGIYTGLHYSQTQKNIVISCDAPLVSESILNWLLNASKNSDITVPKVEERIYPLIGIYSKQILPEIKDSLDKNQLGLTRFLSKVNSKIVTIATQSDQFAKECFSNINTLEELRKLEEISRKN
jgi:molybdenum cofactor guanylyltransferase